MTESLYDFAAILNAHNGNAPASPPPSAAQRTEQDCALQQLYLLAALVSPTHPLDIPEREALGQLLLDIFERLKILT